MIWWLLFWPILWPASCLWSWLIWRPIREARVEAEKELVR